MKKFSNYLVDIGYTYNIAEARSLVVDDPKKVPYTQDEALEQYKREIEYETAFFDIIAETKEYEIIPLPLSDGSQLTDQEKLAIVTFANTHNRKILYRVSLGLHAVVFGLDGGLVGICPEYDPRGFPC